MFHYLLKKGFVLIMVVVFLITFLGQGMGAIIHDSQIVSSSSNSAEFIDQTNGGEGGCGGCGSTGVMFLSKGVNVAQSFIPTHNSVSKISLTISKSGSPPPNTQLMLSVRDSLYGDDLVSINVAADEGSIMFDFVDLEVIAGNTYYMVCTADNSSAPNNGYGWSYTKEDHYLHGSAWIAEGSGSWHSLDEDISGDGADMFFDSYWKDHCPNLPDIEGSSDGKKQTRYDYTFSTTDPENDNVYYYIDWGDGKSMKWIGPYESGEEVTKSHQWASEGDYTIRVKSKDVYGAESDWKNLDIILPKHKQFHSLLLSFLENHPPLFPLLRQLLELQ